MFPCLNSLIDLIWQVDESQYQTKSFHFYLISVVINIAAVLLSLCMEDLSQVFRFNGSVAANLVAFIIPCAFYIKMKSDHNQRILLQKRNMK
mmetsp:Transcript_39189/g.33057  ORF Transcript_39189/g.33057 Transcript_39189/m.33057 type:complete len:92 (-) Transcript_39189:19-294(-)